MSPPFCQALLKDFYKDIVSFFGCRIRSGAVICAGAADTVKDGGMTFYHSVIVALGQMIDLGQKAHGKIADLMAAAAYEVVMGRCPGVKMVGTVPEAQFLDLSGSD